LRKPTPRVIAQPVPGQPVQVIRKWRRCVHCVIDQLLDDVGAGYIEVDVRSDHAVSEDQTAFNTLDQSRRQELVQLCCGRHDLFERTAVQLVLILIPFAAHPPEVTSLDFQAVHSKWTDQHKVHLGPRPVSATCYS
jgi:hypothetical protein